MSVRPIRFNDDGSIDYYFDELGHEGTIPPDQVTYFTNPDGTENADFITLFCQDECGSHSNHPVGGGAAPRMIQELFVRKAVRDGMSPEDAIADVKARVERMDGPDRWQINEEELLLVLSGD